MPSIINKRILCSSISALASGGLVVRCKCEESHTQRGWGEWFRSWTVDEDSLFFERYQHGQDGPGMMQWPTLRRGLRQRAEDEAKARDIIERSRSYIQHCKGTGVDTNIMKNFTEELTSTLYGPGVTAEQRQAYVEKYGCSAYTDSALRTIVKEVYDRPGVVEIGAGNGQWARQLREAHGVDVVAFDSMQALPLQGPAYGPHTEAYQRYFYSNVLVGDESVFARTDLRNVLTGRALLLVFPDPGDMAVKCLRSYTASHPSNDLVIYVGEGRGGANGDSALFDWLESGEWFLVDTMPLQPVGSKGYERLFVFKKKKV